MIGKDIFSNLQNDTQYKEWFQQVVTNGRDYESPFGAKSTNGTPSAQEISNSYMLMKQRRPFVIEFYERSSDTKPKSVTMYINPERLSISNSKIIGKQITRGGIFYHHYGSDHSVMTLAGTTGLSGMAGIKQLEEIYYASGTLLRYKNYTPTQIYGSVSNFNVIDYSSPISVLDKVRTSNYSNEMISSIQSKMYEEGSNNTLNKNTLDNCIEILNIYKNNETLNRLVNDTLISISNDIETWNANGKLDYRSLNQKIIDSLRKEFPTMDDKIITSIAHELSISKRYEDETLLDKTRILNNETNINTLPRTLQLKTMRDNALMTHIKKIKDFENRDKQIRDLLRSGLINITEDMKDEWLPRQLIIYFENRAYIGHFENFSYSRDSKINLINYEMRYVITKQYEFNNLSTGITKPVDTNNNSSSNSSNNSGIVVTPKPPASSSNSNKVTNSKLYTVKSGDTLEGISKQFYGTIDYWSDIYAANVTQIDDPNLIYVGMKLKIPEYSKTVRYWVVRSGDTLWSIASRFYGDANQWKRIYDVNPDIKNANLIYPKQVLKILL